MILSFFQKPKKRQKDSLLKEFTYKDKEVSYRLSLEQYGYDEEKIPLQDYYESLKSIKPLRDRYFFWGLFSYSLLALVYFGAIKSIESYGVALDNSVFLAVSLLLTSVSGIFFANYQNKVARYDSLFLYLFEKSDHANRHDLLLRYPEAYNAMQYNPFITGNPAYTFRKKNFPIRIILLVITIVFVIVVYFALWISLLYATAYDLWNNSPEEWVVINRSILLSSFALYAVSMLLHHGNSGKARYEHHGLVSLLTRLQNKDPKKHLLRIKQINEALKNVNQGSMTGQ